MTGPIDLYLSELERALPRGLGIRGRIVSEAADHLREAAADGDEAGAVERFGGPAAFARSFASLYAGAAARMATPAVVAALSLPILTYPVVENALPPAPWPEGQMPAHLAWKQDAVLALFLAAVGAAAVGVACFRAAGRGLVSALTVTAGTLLVLAALQVVLAHQWAGAVPGTPRWLVAVAAGALVATSGAAALVARALLFAHRAAATAGTAMRRR